MKSLETCGKSEASVTSNDRADSGRFGNRCPLYTCVSSRKDEMTIGGLYVIDGLDSYLRGGCVAVRGNRSVYNQDPDAGLRAGINCGCGLRGSQRDASHSLRLTTREQVKSSIQKKCEKDEPKRCENLMNSKSKWRSTSQKCDPHCARKSDQNGLKHEKAQTGNSTFEIRATALELGSELEAQASKRVGDHCCV